MSCDQTDLKKIDSKHRWNERYSSTDDLLFGAEPNSFLESQRALFQPGVRVLAVADGEGRNGVWLAEQGLEVVSTDISVVAQERAARLAGSRGVSLELTLADLLEWDWPVEQFDIVVAIFIQFADPAERRSIFANIRRALKPGGILLLEGYRPEQLAYRTGGPTDIEKLYTEDMLREAFDDFTILSLRSHDTTISEGSGHRGQSALIDLVARRPAAAFNLREH